MTFRALSRQEAEGIFSLAPAARFPSPTAALPHRRRDAALQPSGDQFVSTAGDGDCLQGLAFALGIETAAVLLCYFAWQLLR